MLAFEDEDEVEADALGDGAVDRGGLGGGRRRRRAGGQAAVAAAPRFAPGGGGGIGAALAATPELLAALDKLPPADDDARTSTSPRAADDPEPFRVARFVRPWRRWLGIGLGARRPRHASSTLLGPAARPARHRPRRRDRRHHRRCGGPWPFFGVAVLADWVVTWGYTLVTGRTAERLLFALRVRIFAHLQRLSLDYYDRELGGPDHDPHDHRRRGAVAAAADRADQRRRRRCSPASACSCSS